ncbi:helix-turn-helix domain-containing protein [Halotia branconii]|uniref:DUF4115 domain-containing protein n=1 Tax=Halotia branconii CENA392 TaxID=1539056 RepID=A0AAJ6NNL4_9CYAN|nr:RodZ domain-containing protein [Halotia branconii]WGV23833.1 DUF4115 domain-containing protein [Halotia branconii CENA392]
MKWFKRKTHQQPTPSLEQQQTEKLAEIGAQLGASRQQRGFSLEEMVALTKIPRRLLQAIEEGNLDNLPEPIYTQGLIRQFADVLGFNGTEFSSNFPVAAQQVKLPTTGNTRSMGQFRPIHLYLLYVFMIVCSVSSLSQLLNNAVLKADNSQSESHPELTQPEKSTIVQPVSDTRSSFKENRSLQIGVTLKASSWIRVVADGKTQFEGILPEGTHRVWKAQEQLTVKTDNAGGVLMSVNQQEAKQMGEPGKVEEIKIAAQPES